MNHGNHGHGQVYQPGRSPTSENAMTPDHDKHQLIQKARAVYEHRQITQQRMADEIGIPRRTLEEWLQGRRLPQASGATLLRRWLGESKQAHGRAQD